ncbi:MAG: SDR family oxidoreductase [Candidatus Competibacteraceae bacterium]|nr:SDR family oxidoreductase [Candidatus Competibacteraceae bacterium]
MTRILIAGCGDVGSRLGLLLSQAGHQVWGLRRNPNLLPEPIEPLAADLAHPTDLEDLPAGLEAIYYTASADARDEVHYRMAYLDGPRHLLQALAAAGQSPRRVFFTSSTSVYAQNQGQWVDEDSPAQGRGTTGALMVQGERIWLQGHFPATVVRLAGLYGPGRTRLIDSVRRGAVCQDQAFTNRIHVEDAARVLAHLLTLPDPAPLYCAVDDDPATQCQVFGWLAERLKAPAPRVETTGPSNKRIRNALLKASGFTFHYPTFREGYGEMLDNG